MDLTVYIFSPLIVLHLYAISLGQAASHSSKNEEDDEADYENFELDENMDHDESEQDYINVDSDHSEQDYINVDSDHSEQDYVNVHSDDS